MLHLLKRLFPVQRINVPVKHDPIGELLAESSVILDVAYHAAAKKVDHPQRIQTSHGSRSLREYFFDELLCSLLPHVDLGSQRTRAELLYELDKGLPLSRFVSKIEIEIMALVVKNEERSFQTVEVEARAFNSFCLSPADCKL